MKKNNVCAYYSLKHMDMDVRYPQGTEARSSKLMCLKNALFAKIMDLFAKIIDSFAKIIDSFAK